MPKRSPSDWVLEALAFAALAAILLVVAAYWTDIPARIPTHFGVSGNPDGWGKRNGILLLPLTAIGLFLLLTIVSRYQGLINVPMAIERDAPEVQRLLQSMSIVLKVVVLLVFLYLEWRQVNTALGRTRGLGKLFLPVSLVAVFLPLGYYLRKLWAYRK
jgi:uncharacterized membrane protein